MDEGKNGFHVHTLGDLTEGCLAAAGHYNPENMNHGGPDDEVRHHGDMGNIISDGINPATYDKEDNLLQLYGEYSIIGRSVMVHAGEDDLGKGGDAGSLSTGNAGSRLACGTIVLTSP